MRLSQFDCSRIALATTVAALCLFITQAPARAAEKFVQADQDLVDAVTGNLRMGMESGKLAKDRANHKVVKDYAADVVKDHQKLWDELRELCKRHNYNPDTALSKDDEKMKTQLKDLEGQHFDERFVKMSMHEHEQLIAEFRKGADTAKSEDLKKFFDANEKIIRDDLDQAKELNDKLATDDAEKDKKK